MENPECRAAARKDVQVTSGAKRKRTKEIVQNFVSFARQRPAAAPDQCRSINIFAPNDAMRSYDFANPRSADLEKCNLSLMS